MGLFSTRKQTVVGTSVCRVVDDAHIPNSAMTGTLNAIFKGTDIGTEVLDAMLHGIGITANRVYSFGRDKYIYGLPSGQIVSNAQGMEEAKAILEAQEGKAIVINYSRVGAANLLHLAWMYIIANYGYDPETNTLQNIPVDDRWANLPKPEDWDSGVYLHDMAVMVDNINDSTEMTEMWGVAPSAGNTPERKAGGDYGFDTDAPYAPIIVNASFDGFRLTYAWTVRDYRPGYTDGNLDVPNFKVEKGTIDIPLPASATEDDFIHVKYTTVDGDIKYWMYRLGEGTYPTLDAIQGTPPVSSGQYFPFLYFRTKKQRIDNDKESREYKDAKKYAKFLKLDLDEVIEAIHSTEGRDQSDVDDLDQALMTFAIPANTDNQDELKYLWEFMNLWHTQAEGKYGDPNLDAERTNRSGDNYVPVIVSGKEDDEGIDVARTGIIIQDTNFKLALTNGGIYKKLVAKKIGPIGTVELSRGEVWTRRKVRHQTGNGGPDEDTYYTIEEIPVTTHIYGKQVSPEYVEELHVVSLGMLYHVWDRYSVLGNDDEDLLLIPIDKTIVDRMPTIKKELLYARSLHFVFNMQTYIKIKWYQTTFFSMLFIIVAAFVSFLMGGSDGGSLLSAAIGGSVIAATIIINTIVVNILISMAIQFAFTVVAEELGARLTMILAAAAILVGGIGQLSDASGTWASNLLQVGNGLMNGVDSAMQSDLLSLQESVDAARDFYGQELDAVTQLTNELDAGLNRLNPFVIFGESPEQFYNRTVHSGNIGVAGIEAVSSYVKNALKLPTMAETIPLNLYQG